jgi:hypothetical protein
MEIQSQFPKKIFFGAVILALVGGTISLFYYAYLMPLHVDEGGFWFNYTNKSLRYRFIFNPLNPNHTLTIYLAKVSLWAFGNNGIGWRLPVILFSMLSAGILYLFVKRVTASRLTAVLASTLLFLNPFFLHYSHELRAYPAYFFFLVCCYLCIHSLLENGNRVFTWVLLLLSFIACYIANLAAPMFYTILLASLWILTMLAKFSPLRSRLPGFEKIQIRSFFIFSVLAASLFAFIMFYVDRAIMPNLFKVQISESNLLAIPDVFSAFLGFQYLDDRTSLLYAYPVFIWLISLTSFLFGWWCVFKSKHWAASLFLTLFISNSLFYISLGTWIPVRSSIFLLPFILIFQAHGLKALCEIVASRFFPNSSRENFAYLALAGIVFCYFFLFSKGKYKNFEPDSGNPYELTRTYLKENTGPNDLILSNLYDTVGGFYLGDLMREKVSNIYNNGKIENIYYLTAKPTDNKIRFQMTFPKPQSLALLPLDKFERVVSFQNKGVRPSQVHIYKRKLDVRPVMHLDSQALAIPEYFGNFNRTCKRRVDGQGLRISCENSELACANLQVTVNGVTENDFQFVLFHHENDRGAKAISFASIKSMAQKKSLPKGTIFIPIPDEYRVNPIINNIQDLDVYREKVDLMDIGLQKMGAGNQAMLCMVGKLFKDNSLIKGVSAFNYTP